MSADDRLAGLPVGLLDRYVADECTPDEVQAVHAWLDGDATRHAILTGLREIRYAARTRGPWDTPRMWRRLADAMAADATPTLVVRRPMTAPRFATTGYNRLWPRLVPMAAAALVLSAVAFFTVRRVIAPPATSEAVYATTPGQRTTVRLADGTSVMLAPASRLVVQPDFGKFNRTVSLSGEAVFTVTTSHTAPFLVRTKQITTRVLGTAFDVRRYPTDRATQVVVLSGKVATGSAAAPIVLTAGMMGRVFDSSAVLGTARDAETATSWTRGRLVFRDAPVAEMLATLERWYGYEFRLVDTTLLTQHVSLALAINRPVEAMNTVKAILNVSMTFDGHIITLRPEQVNADEPRAKSRRTEFSTHELEVGK